MALAPPTYREIEVLILSDLRLGSPYARARALLAELDATRVATLILLGSPLADPSLDPYALPEADRAVLETFERLAAGGVRVYCLGPCWRSASGAVGPSGHGVALGAQIHFRDELHFRIDGIDTLFLSPRLPRWHRRFDEWIEACGTLSREWAQRLRLRRDAALARALEDEAAARGAGVVVLPFSAGDLGARMRHNLPHLSVQECGSWALARSVAEYRFGRWTVRDVLLAPAIAR